MYARGLVLSLLLLGAPHFAAGDTFTFSPDPEDMSDLDHHWVYEWGIDVTLPANEHVVYAELTFEDIRNWDSNPNDLYVHLLDWAQLGFRQYYDNQRGGDNFAGRVPAPTHLVTYEDLPTTPQDLTYVFTADELVALNGYLADERIGIGMDPDCHYWNNGVELKLITPEPGSLALLGMGGIALLRRVRR
ncbi:MAG: PEP-CTERM sorting domain-containing protein [bacterium]|nr:PEP-CTERM sorting domain-containing protein [bacterium]